MTRPVPPQGVPLHIRGSHLAGLPRQARHHGPGGRFRRHGSTAGESGGPDPTVLSGVWVSLGTAPHFLPGHLRRTPHRPGPAQLLGAEAETSVLPPWVSPPHPPRLPLIGLSPTQTTPCCGLEHGGLGHPNPVLSPPGCWVWTRSWATRSTSGYRTFAGTSCLACWAGWAPCTRWSSSVSVWFWRRQGGGFRGSCQWRP